MLQNQLTIDLSKEKFNFSAIPNLHEIITIRFENYTDKIEIPLAINEYPNITILKFIGKSGRDAFKTPDNLEKLINIKVLIIWNFCGFTKMKPMPHLEKLNIVVKNTETDTRNVVTLFPNLKKMEILGGHLNDQNLPDEIGNLTSLESLHLVSCGLNDLPESFINLKQLKELNLRGNGINVFPEVITQLENLEILEIQQSLTKLPDSLSNLKKLSKLNLNSALNGGNMDVAGDFLNEDKIYLKPIPEVIGKLENLKDLNLGICGVFDVTPILSLKKLKKLNLKYSALKNCNDFSNFSMLDELNLETSYNLKNLDGLKGLPLKKLIISSDYSIKSIKVISDLESLETLNINGCNNIKDYSPLYSNSSIKKLQADSKITKKWKKRAEYNKLPKIPAIIDQLETDELQQFEKAIYHLSKHVDANYSDENNPLAGYFDVEADEEETTFIESLDNAIQKHIKDLSEETLVTIFGMTFKTVGNDNYNAALLALEEIIARKNIETQQLIVKEFYKACKYYDAGHRYWSYTIHDQLIDTLFAQFTSEALYKLLKKASTDMLNSEGGDAMDELFVAAFKNTTNIKLQEKLLNVFFKYEEEARTYFGKAYFDGLMQQIKDAATPELENLILAKKEENIEQEKWLTLLENLNAENLPEVIEQFVNQSTEDCNEEDLYKITEASKKINLPETSLQILLDFILVKGENNYLYGLLIASYHKNSPDKIIDFLKAQLEKSKLEIIDAYNIAKNIIIELIGLNESLDELKIYENFIVSHCNVSFDEVYNLEIKKLLSKFFKYDSYRSDQDISWTLKKTKAIALKIEGKISYSDLRYDTYSLMDSEEYDRVKQAFEVLYPKTKELKEEGVLFYNIIAVIKLNDEPYFDLLHNEVQQLKQIKEVLLAFNLACGFAHFKRKNEMLFYIKESIRLGKTTQQFLDDTDFKKYWEDKDFLKVIEEK